MRRILLSIQCMLVLPVLNAVGATTVPGVEPPVLRWDFTGVFHTTWGMGSGLAGVVEGASLSGKIEALDDFAFVSSYQKFDGYLTIYGSATAVLTYTVMSGAASHTYSFTEGIHALITQKNGGNSYRVEFSAPFFQMAKDVTGSAIPDASFGSFADATARGVADGTGHILIANGNWSNANMASIDSLEMVPEPSIFLLTAVAGMPALLRRARKSVS